MKQNKTFYKLVATLARPFLKIVFPCEIVGLEKVKNLSSGYVLCSNHLSNMDPIFFVLFHPVPVCFMAKAELFKNKLFGCFFSLLGAFAVKRGAGDRQALNEAEKIVKSGGVLGIFIEGTRSKSGEFLRPKSGAAFVAYSTKAAVVPVCITGGGANNKICAFKKTVIKYGKPIMPDDMKIENCARNELKFATNLIMEKIKELRS